MFGFPNTFGVFGYLTLGLIYEIIFPCSALGRATTERFYIMTESKAPQGKAVPKLVKAYGSLVASGDEGVVACQGFLS